MSVRSPHHFQDSDAVSHTAASSPQASPTPGWLDLWPPSLAGELTSRCAGSRPLWPLRPLRPDFLWPSPALGFCRGVLSRGFVPFCSDSPLFPPSPGLPARLLLTSSTKSIARRGRTRSPSHPLPAPPPGFLLGIMGALCGLISLLRGPGGGSASPHGRRWK